MLSRRLLRIKVLKALYAHFKSESDSLIASEKNLMFSIDKTYELYHQLLWLIVDVATWAENRIELGRKKHLPTEEERNPNTKFIENRVVALLRGSENLTDYLAAHKLGWIQYPELIKSLYNSMVASDYYKEYMSSPTRSFKEDRKFVENFYTQTVDGCEELENVVEEQSIFWADDLDFANIMVVRTVSNMKASQTEVDLLPEYKNEDDREYAKELFRQTVIHYNEYYKYIGRFTKNWDVDRIAFMDNLIMAATVAELIAFPSIPVKVTFDEFIEIAKYYSTPSSSTFINGVLDKVVEALREEGKINKSGRGLLEK